MEKTIRSLSPETYWEIEQQNQLLDMLYKLKLSIISLLKGKKSDAVLKKTPIELLIAELNESYQLPLKQYFSNYSELKSTPTKCDLTTLSVCLHRLAVFL